MSVSAMSAFRDYMKILECLVDLNGAFVMIELTQWIFPDCLPILLSIYVFPLFSFGFHVVD